jgi:hypothetical protein
MRGFSIGVYALEIFSSDDVYMSEGPLWFG